MTGNEKPPVVGPGASYCNRTATRAGLKGRDLQPVTDLACGEVVYLRVPGHAGTLTGADVLVDAVAGSFSP
jgi:hypothetical protein